MQAAISVRNSYYDIGLADLANSKC